MAFPGTVPANNTEHSEDNEDFLVQNGRWTRKPDGVYVDTYEISAGGLIWGRQPLQHPAHHMIRVRGEVRFPSVGDVAINLYDNTPAQLDLSGATCYGMAEWGNGGIEQANWQAWQDFSGNKGITLNVANATNHLKVNYTYEIECDIYRISNTETALRSRMYYYSESNVAMYTMLLAWFPHPITAIKQIGLRTTAPGVIHTMSFNVEYW